MESDTNCNSQEEQRTKMEQKEQRKCFCARCFLPIDPDDRVEIECQNFHKICGMCCVCRQTPKSLKSFYGHVFCSDCFKTHVLNRFRGIDATAHCNSWWMHWGPRDSNFPEEEAENTTHTDSKHEKHEKEKKKEKGSKSKAKEEQEPPKKCFCARCLHVIMENDKVDIGGQTFHTQCARCCCCHTVPTTSLKIFYGQVFCEECFQRYNVLSQRGDKEFNPDSMRFYFDQWHNPSFVEHMKEFMKNSDNKPQTVYVNPGGQPSFCSLGPQVAEWMTANEGKTASTVEDWDLSFEERIEDTNTDISPLRPESAEPLLAAQKIEKLTKLIQGTIELKNSNKKWKMFDQPTTKGHASFAMLRKNVKKLRDTKCLWQYGVIYV